MRKSVVPIAVLALAAACSDVSSPPQARRVVQHPGGVAPIYAKAGGIPGQYIVVLKDDVDDQNSAEGQLVGQNGGTLTYSYRHALKGFAARLSTDAVARVARDPRVRYIEQDQPVHAIVTQTPATWGLDRIDQRALPLNNSYIYNADGTGVTVYIIDTGIRFDHVEFGGRAVTGVDEVTPGGTAADCNGHGTHVAGTVGGTTYGVAKKVKLVAVRVLDCSGSGTFSGVTAGVDWVTGQKQANPTVPMAANMSLGGGATQALDDAVARSTAAGVVHVVAAGNSSADACTQSPARAPSAITVGATDDTDTRASFSNYGTCLDIFAPGVNITSAWYTTATATNTISGTSMASPHTAGAAALYLQTNPSASVATVTSALTTNATAGAVIDPGPGSPNLLLYTGFISAAPQPPVADFTFTCNLLSCSFDGSPSTAQPTATYTWAWGDATPNGSGKTATHSYATSGTYNVTLTVTDAIGTSSKTKAVTVSNAPPPTPKPVADFTFSCTMLTCNFTNTSTAQTNATWSWSFGDGTPNSTVKSPSHTYALPGTYNVTLTATDAGGTSSVTKPVTVANCSNGDGEC